MLKSTRRFGVEIEFVAPSPESMRTIRRLIHVVDDGSLRPLQNAGEWVSEPLSGKAGEKRVITACKVLKKYKASCENVKTSMHIHLDGKVGEGVLKSSRTSPKTAQPVFAFSNKLKGELGVGSILDIVSRRHFGIIDGHVTEIDNITYHSKVELVRKPRLNYTYYYLEKPDRFKWLKNSFYFYTLFSGVMENIVSNSRRFGNMYCIPLGDSYAIEEIANMNDMAELKNLWYKGRDPRQAMQPRYDDSRYHNVNLHSFWDRHGTLEIRSHGGTIEHNKVLLWLRLHQTIADKLEDIEFDELRLITGTPEEFIKFVDDEMLSEYIKRLLGYYSGIKIK